MSKRPRSSKGQAGGKTKKQRVERGESKQQKRKQQPVPPETFLLKSRTYNVAIQAWHAAMPIRRQIQCRVSIDVQCWVNDKPQFSEEATKGFPSDVFEYAPQPPFWYIVDAREPFPLREIGIDMVRLAYDAPETDYDSDRATSGPLAHIGDTVRLRIGATLLEVTSQQEAKHPEPAALMPIGQAELLDTKFVFKDNLLEATSETLWDQQYWIRLDTHPPLALVCEEIVDRGVREPSYRGPPTYKKSKDPPLYTLKRAFLSDVSDEQLLSAFGLKPSWIKVIPPSRIPAKSSGFFADYGE